MPSLCPLAGHPPSDPRLLQVNDTLNFIPGQECNLVVQGWKELEKPEDEARGLEDPFVHLIRHVILEWVVNPRVSERRRDGSEGKRREGM